MSDPTDGPMEQDPSGRYVRFRKVLGRGAFKTVYAAFDNQEALEVAWNRLNVDRLNPDVRSKVQNEVALLRRLDHKNIIKFYGSFACAGEDGVESLDFITEQMMSGTLKDYLKKAKVVKLKVIRRWCQCILDAIAYLHGQRIMHRDLKLDNLFVNGHVGDVKIGDLGLSAVRDAEKAESVIGTPEFMAPELYEESYTEKVDIYAFGMCLLEMVSMEYPYAECKGPAQIMMKALSGEKPAAFFKLVDSDVKDVVEHCLKRESERPTAAELLEHPLFRDWGSDDGTRSNLSLIEGTAESAQNNPMPEQAANEDLAVGLKMIAFSENLNRDMYVAMQAPDESAPTNEHPGVHVAQAEEGPAFRLGIDIPIEGLGIKRVEFSISTTDQPHFVAQEMVAELKLDPAFIPGLTVEIENQLRQHQEHRGREQQLSLARSPSSATTPSTTEQEVDPHSSSSGSQPSAADQDALTPPRAQQSGHMPSANNSPRLSAVSSPPRVDVPTREETEPALAESQPDSAGSFPAQRVDAFSSTGHGRMQVDTSQDLKPGNGNETNGPVKVEPSAGKEHGGSISAAGPTSTQYTSTDHGGKQSVPTQGSDDSDHRDHSNVVNQESLSAAPPVSHPHDSAPEAPRVKELLPGEAALAASHGLSAVHAHRSASRAPVAQPSRDAYSVVSPSSSVNSDLRATRSSGGVRPIVVVVGDRSGGGAVNRDTASPSPPPSSDPGERPSVAAVPDVDSKNISPLVNSHVLAPVAMLASHADGHRSAGIAAIAASGGHSGPALTNNPISNRGDATNHDVDRSGHMPSSEDAPSFPTSISASSIPGTQTGSQGPVPSHSDLSMRTSSWRSVHSDESIGMNPAPPGPGMAGTAVPFSGSPENDQDRQKWYLMCLELMENVARGRVAHVKQKLAQGATVNYADYDKRTPLHLAACEGHLAVCSVLLESGADVNARDRWGKTPLADARTANHVEVARVLEKAGAIDDEVETGDDEKNDAAVSSGIQLLQACSVGNLAVVENLVSSGVSVKFVDYSGRTALHNACRTESADLVEYLLRSGADVNTKDRSGATPMDLAAKNGSKQIVQVLERYGGEVPSWWRDTDSAQTSHRVPSGEVLVKPHSDTNGSDAMHGCMKARPKSTSAQNQFQAINAAVAISHSMSMGHIGVGADGFASSRALNGSNGSSSAGLGSSDSFSASNHHSSQSLPMTPFEAAAAAVGLAEGADLDEEGVRVLRAFEQEYADKRNQLQEALRRGSRTHGMVNSDDPTASARGDASAGDASRQTYWPTTASSGSAIADSGTLSPPKRPSQSPSPKSSSPEVLSTVSPGTKSLAGAAVLPQSAHLPAQMIVPKVDDTVITEPVLTGELYMATGGTEPSSPVRAWRTPGGDQNLNESLPSSQMTRELWELEAGDERAVVAGDPNACVERRVECSDSPGRPQRDFSDGNVADSSPQGNNGIDPEASLEG